jgi:hypothetical protein
LIIAPYHAQVEYLRTAFQQAGISAQDSRDIRFANTNKVSGIEASIVLLSLVKNLNPATEVGFVSNKEQLTVEMSRASDFLIIFGNFTGWAECFRRGEWKTTGKKDFESFIDDICFQSRREVIAHEDWVQAFLATPTSVPTERDRFISRMPKRAIPGKRQGATSRRHSSDHKKICV